MPTTNTHTANQHPTLTGAEILWATLDGEDIAARLVAFVAPHPRYKRGVFAKCSRKLPRQRQRRGTYQPRPKA